MIYFLIKLLFIFIKINFFINICNYSVIYKKYTFIFILIMSFIEAWFVRPYLKNNKQAKPLQGILFRFYLFVYFHYTIFFPSQRAEYTYTINLFAFFIILKNTLYLANKINQEKTKPVDFALFISGSFLFMYIQKFYFINFKFMLFFLFELF